MLVDEAYAHPAKFSYGLILRIIRHGLEQGYWKAGDLLGDCFAGVACGGLVAAYHGLRWFGEELEQRFVDLGNENIAKHRPRWKVSGDPCPVLVQGDSRGFAGLVGQCEAIVTSPPYADSVNQATTANDPEARIQRKATAGVDVTKSVNVGGPNSVLRQSQAYGTTPGQIGALPAGKLDGIVTSPPFGGSDQPCASQSQAKKDYHAFTRGDGTKRSHQMKTEGNIGNLREGQLDAVVTSPPWERSGTTDHEGQTDALKGGKFQGGGDAFLSNYEYGKSPGQIGNEQAETYWQAVAAVYEQCRLALKPGGLLVVVVKDYVKGGKRVPLCDDTAKLLDSLGFDVFERTKCHLVETKEHPSLFGGTVTRKKSRKSFFRRLAESKGSPAIDWEEVLWSRSRAK